MPGEDVSMVGVIGWLEEWTHTLSLIIHELREKKSVYNFTPRPHFSDSPWTQQQADWFVKMADCIRVPLLLLLMCALSFVHPIRGENSIVAKLAAKADNPQNPAGGPGPAAANPGAAEKNLGAGASLLRKRSTGWKLAEEAVCREDLTRLCPKHSWNNNLSVLECLQDKKEVN